MSINGTAWSYWVASDQQSVFDYRPTIRVPPVPGQRQRLTSLVVAVTTKTPMTTANGCVVRDGESGSVGTILWSGALVCSAQGEGDTITVIFGDQNPIYSSVGNALTIEFFNVLTVTGANDFVSIAVTGVSTTDAPPTDLWRLSVLGSVNVAEKAAPGVGLRLAVIAWSFYLRMPSSNGQASQGITLGTGFDALPLANGGKGKPLWGVYTPRPGNVGVWGRRDYDLVFPSPILGEENGTLVVRADGTETGGLIGINVWGRVVSVDGGIVS